MSDEAKLEKLIAELKECNTGDVEADHANADELLIEYIDDPRVTEAYENIRKWYA